jgi:hypothetical protein
MLNRLDRAHRALPVALGGVTLAGVVLLLVWDAYPKLFPPGSHDVLAAFTLAGIAVAYLIYQSAHRPPVRELIKAVLLAAAFFFWAANQLWPESPQATLYNDIAVALFILDVFLVMIGWPAASTDSSFAESFVEQPEEG